MLDYKIGDRLPVHNHGYVALIDSMGDDESVVDAARISYDRRGRSADRALIRYLLRHKHTSPFEMAVLKFEIKMPIFVARQWVRHRTASINEVSARYTELPKEMFIPHEFSIQSTDNKQGRGAKLEPHTEHAVRKLMDASNEDSYAVYEELLSYGVARETAREVLNLNIYTKFIWKMDLHNLMHFMNLRLDSHAQKEIREYAETVERIVALYFPLCYEAFVDYVRDSYTCSRMEIDILKMLLKDYKDNYWPDVGLWASELAFKAGMSDRETNEFLEKFFDG